MAGAPICYRCGRIRTPEQLHVTRTKSVTLRRCIDEQDCADHQTKTGKYAPKQQPPGVSAEDPDALHPAAP